MEGLSRREFMRNVGIVAAAAWVPVFTIRAGNAQTYAAPTEFPADIELYRQAYENWSGEIRVADVWTCAPRTASEVLTVVNWAFAHRYRVRPQGMRHNWSPLTITSSDSCDTPVLLVDTTRYLTAMKRASTSEPAVDVQVGATLTTVLQFLEDDGLGFTATPSVGEISVGGALAINGHGASVPSLGESRAGRTYGSLSNRVLALTAVVWDQGAGAYVLKRFDRRHPDTKALLTHLGRAFITDVTLLAGKNDNLRCVSHVDIPAAEIFAPEGSSGRTFTKFLDEAGRVEAIWFAFTEKPWLKVWSVAPNKPRGSREVTEPYNYPFADNVPKELGDLAEQILTTKGSLTPLFGQGMYEGVTAGLRATDAADLWGASKNTLLYVKPSTMPARQSSMAVLTSRTNVQRVIHEYVTRYQTMVESYRSRDRFPINVALEIRVTGLDDPSEVPAIGAEPPSLSSLSPRRDHPEWDVAVWLGVLTLPGTAHVNVFVAELEAWMMSNYTEPYAGVRPEWSKAWAYTDHGPWQDPTMIAHAIPNAYRTGLAPGDNWDSAITTLNALDPHRTFGNDFLDVLLT